MSGFLEQMYSQLPQNEQHALKYVNAKNGLSRLREICESVEAPSQGNKMNEWQARSYMFQLLIYMITDQLPLAKYLWKRLPDAIKADPQMKSIWDIGKAMFKDQYSQVYKLIKSTKLSKLVLPFIQRLENDYRLRCINIVNLAYTSITIKELNSYIGLSSTEQLATFIKQQNMTDQWVFDNQQKPTKVEIHALVEDFSKLLDTQMLDRFTHYVCFMEAQQTLQIDDTLANNKKSSQQ